MPRCNLLSVKTDSKTIGVLDIGRIRLRHQLSFYGVPFALGNLDRTVFGAVTFPSCSSVVSLIIKQISLSQSSSVRTNPHNVLVLVAVSAFPICGLRHLMKLVPFATGVRMHVKAFPSRPSTSDAEDEEVHQMVKKKELFKWHYFIFISMNVAVLLASHCFHSHCRTNITSSPELLWSFICSWPRDKSCSHHFVLNLASQTSISLSQSSSVRTNPDNVLVLVAVSAFSICGLRHPMKLVPFATRVRMHVKAFPSRPSVPLLITNSIIHHPRRRLRLCPRANKNLHIPAGYAQSILMHNLCKFLIAYG
ncbi:hypothetical protein T07_3144 [Trichinella nelsoni]|uniref:Uncharacterized protein n=1 Tax=Trichinella nelsoni TaxID=6336 RepID=A0A0V0SJL6_9BILA|nr:hypothetical protein T07_3144 [Trichinella nelsoni]